jgi:acyl-coenzyme A synthetase/AMP-(fatty) acid ligase
MAKLSAAERQRPELGQRVRAYVALKPGAHATDAELINWTTQKIAAYKMSETITCLAALPKGQTGKVLRKALRDQASSSAALKRPARTFHFQRNDSEDEVHARTIFTVQNRVIG